MTEENKSLALAVLAAYIKEWGTKPTAVELAGYETPDAVSCPAFRSPMSTAKTLQSLSARGLVARFKTKWGFVYAVTETPSA